MENIPVCKTCFSNIEVLLQYLGMNFLYNTDLLVGESMEFTKMFPRIYQMPNPFCSIYWNLISCKKEEWLWKLGVNLTSIPCKGSQLSWTFMARMEHSLRLEERKKLPNNFLMLLLFFVLYFETYWTPNCNPITLTTEPQSSPPARTVQVMRLPR